MQRLSINKVVKRKHVDYKFVVCNTMIRSASLFVKCEISNMSFSLFINAAFSIVFYIRKQYYFFLLREIYNNDL